MYFFDYIILNIRHLNTNRINKRGESDLYITHQLYVLNIWVLRTFLIHQFKWLR